MSSLSNGSTDDSDNSDGVTIIALVFVVLMLSCCILVIFFYRRKRAEESDSNHKTVFSNPSFQYENGGSPENVYVKHDATSGSGLPTSESVYLAPTPLQTDATGVVYDSASTEVLSLNALDSSQDGYLHVNGDEPPVMRAAENPLNAQAHAADAPHSILLSDDFEDEGDLSI